MKEEHTVTEERALVQNNAQTPMGLLEMALAKGADLDQLQKLMDLQERNETRVARQAYNEAMSNFRCDCPTIERTRKGHNGKYAGLSESIDQIKTLLSVNGLSHQWKTSQDNGQITVQCIVTHRLGHSESTTLSAEPDNSGKKNSIQSIGSTVSYLERYTLFAILGLASQEMDDDGRKSEGPKDPVISEEQLANLEALVDEVKADKTALLSWLRVEDLAELPAKNYGTAVKALEAKRGQ